MRKLVYWLAFVALLISAECYSVAGDATVAETPAPSLEQIEALFDESEAQQFFAFLDDQIAQIEMKGSTPEELAKIKDSIIGRSMEQYTRHLFCASCQKFYAKLQSSDFKGILSFIDNVIIYLCQKLKIENEEVCAGLIPQQVQSIATALQQHYFDPRKACPKLGLCPDYYQKINIDHLVRDILKDKPKRQRPVPTGNRTYKVLQVTDMHIDLKYVVGENIYCNYIICCRDQEEKNRERSKFEPAGQWGSEALCDLPIQTVSQFAGFVKKRLNVDLAIWNGDNQGRDIWQQTIPELINITNITTEILKQIEGLTFIPLLGNHDSVPCNILDMKKINETQIIQISAELWRSWIGDSAADQYKQLGYYKYYDAKLDILILVLNTQACYADNLDLIADPTDPGDQLKWLRKELELAEKLDLKVYVVGHVPPVGCLTRWGKVYNAIINRFEYIVRGQFFGHEHADSFQIQKDGKSGIYGIPFLGPALTSENDDGYLLPSFRVYEIDADTKIPINMLTYRLNLTYWNQFPDAEQIEWDMAVDFLKEYHLPNMYDYNQFAHLQEQIKKDPAVRDKFWYNYHQGNRPYNITKKKDPKLHCSMESLYLDEAVCKKSITNYLLEYAIDKISGDWLEPIYKDQEE